MYKFIFKIKDEKLFSESWDNFISDQEVSLRYTRSFIKYMLALKDNIIDQSFVVIFQEKVVGIAFVPIETSNNNQNSISIKEDYIMCPLSINQKVMKVIHEKIELLAKKFLVTKIMFQLDPLIQEHIRNYNPLIKYKFIDTSCNDYVLDLRLSKENFMKNLDTSHRKSIKKFKNNHDYNVNIYKKENIDREIFEKYKKAHFICSGRLTRPETSFAIQYEMILGRLAYLQVLEYENKSIGFLLVAMFQKTAAFFSTANLPEYEKEVPIYKLLVLEAFNYLKAKRFDFVHFGTPANDSIVSNFGNYCDQKQLRISKYKLGYNPIIINKYRGIKYCNKEAFKKDLKIFKSKVLSFIK